MVYVMPEVTDEIVILGRKRIGKVHDRLAAGGDEMPLKRLSGGEDLLAANTLDQLNRVSIEAHQVRRSETFTFPPASVTVLEIDLE
jgi:hypothetical protein